MRPAPSPAPPGRTPPRRASRPSAVRRARRPDARPAARHSSPRRAPRQVEPASRIPSWVLCPSSRASVSPSPYSASARDHRSLVASSRARWKSRCGRAPTEVSARAVLDGAQQPPGGPLLAEEHRAHHQPGRVHLGGRKRGLAAEQLETVGELDRTVLSVENLSHTDGQPAAAGGAVQATSRWGKDSARRSDDDGKPPSGGGGGSSTACATRWRAWWGSVSATSRAAATRMAQASSRAPLRVVMAPRRAPARLRVAGGTAPDVAASSSRNAQAVSPASNAAAAAATPRSAPQDVVVGQLGGAFQCRRRDGVGTAAPGVGSYVLQSGGRVGVRPQRRRRGVPGAARGVVAGQGGQDCGVDLAAAVGGQARVGGRPDQRMREHDAVRGRPRQRRRLDPRQQAGSSPRVAAPPRTTRTSPAAASTKRQGASWPRALPPSRPPYEPLGQRRGDGYRFERRGP